MNKGLFDNGADDSAIKAGIEADIQKELARTPKRLSRQDDPDTSHAAAVAIEADLAALHAEVEALVKRWPGQTANELASFKRERDVRRIGRRLPELEELGRIRRGEPRPCGITGRKAATWWPK